MLSTRSARDQVSLHKRSVAAARREAMQLQTRLHRLRIEIMRAEDRLAREVKKLIEAEHAVAEIRAIEVTHG
jgi:hypothetical protein